MNKEKYTKEAFFASLEEADEHLRKAEEIRQGMEKTLSMIHPTRERTPVTVCIQINNSDAKLSQTMWASYCLELRNTCEDFGDINFSGGPATNAPFQNYCVIAAVNWDKTDLLETKLIELRKKYKQDSFAWLSGETFFL
jgi:hypothetical protein